MIEWNAKDSLLYLLFSVAFAMPLVVSWILFRVRTQTRWRAFDVLFVVWCLSFFLLLHGVAIPLASNIQIDPQAGARFMVLYDWPHTLIAPGAPGLVTALLLWHGTNSRTTLVATLIATAFACVIVRFMQWYSELPAALLWNAIVSAAVLSAARRASDRNAAAKSDSVPISDVNAPNSTAKP